MASPDQKTANGPSTFQPLPPNAPGIPGVSSEPIEMTPQMEHDLADASPSEGSGVTGSVHRNDQADRGPQAQPGGPA